VGFQCKGCPTCLNVFILRKESSSARLDTNLRRIFLERGADFFDRKEGLQSSSTRLEIKQSQGIDDASVASIESENTSKSMTVEELYAMRMELLPQLLCVIAELYALLRNFFQCGFRRNVSCKRTIDLGVVNLAG
jgi:hypothetical protein